MATLDYTVNVGSNDAWWDTSAINTGAAGFRLGTVGGAGGFRSSFARWNVTIPAGATIGTAYVTLTDWWNESTSASVTTTIAGHDADNPAALTTQAGCVSATRTTATVSFVWASGTAQTTDTEHTTPELKTIIQELVNSYSYSSGAALTLLFDYASVSADRQLVFNAYDDSTTKAPKLHIEYTEAATTKIPILMNQYRQRKV